MNKWKETGRGQKPEADLIYFIRWNISSANYDPEQHAEFEEGNPIEKSSGLWKYGITHYREASGTMEDAIREFYEHHPAFK
jgi:hypothetical protein